MIEHLPDMDNRRRGEERLFLRLFLLVAKACRLFSSFRLFTKSQNQVIVLGTVIFLLLVNLLSCFSLLRYRLQQRTLRNQKMAEIIYTAEKLRTVVRLKVGFKIVGRGKVNLVLIAIEKLRLGMLLDGFCNGI